MCPRCDPVDGKLRVLLRGLSKHPADRLSDKELALFKHRVCVAGEAIEVALALPQRDQVDQQRRAAHPEIVIRLGNRELVRRRPLERVLGLLDEEGERSAATAEQPLPAA